MKQNRWRSKVLWTALGGLLVAVFGAFKRRKNSGHRAWQCSTYMERGKVCCPAKQIREFILEDVSASAMGLSNFDLVVFERQVREIRVCDENRLIFAFQGGSSKEITWEPPSRRDSWDEAARERGCSCGQKNASHTRQDRQRGTF